MDPVLNYINGIFQPRCIQRYVGHRQPRHGPGDHHLAPFSSDDVAEATRAALSALPSGLQTTMEERMTWLHRIADALEADAETIAQLEHGHRQAHHTRKKS